MKEDKREAEGCGIRWVSRWNWEGFAMEVGE